MNKSPEDAGKGLIRLYKNKGFKAGKYVITRDKIYELTGRTRLYGSYLMKLEKCLNQLGYTFFPIPNSRDQKFAVIRNSLFNKWRTIDA
jgi:hypothetical protein